MTEFFSIALTFFFVIDAFGIIPAFLSLVKKCEKKRQRFLACRELLFALITMVLFFFVGKALLSFLSLNQTTVQIAGGITLFLIAIRLIFLTEETKADSIWGEKEPFIVPIATPLIAGPSLLAIIMIYSLEEPNKYLVLGAILLAWAVSSVMLLLANPINKMLGSKGLMACQRLMGLIVALIAVQMFLEGVAHFIGHK